MEIWKITPGSQAVNWDYAKETNCIFIGWPKVGDVTKYESREDLIGAYQELYNVEHRPINNSFSLWAFSHDVQIGDIVIANKGSKSIVGIGRITGNYEFLNEGLQEGDEKYDYYPHSRSVEWFITQQIDFPKQIFEQKTLSRVKPEKEEAIRQAVFDQVPNGRELWAQFKGRTSDSGHTVEQKEKEEAHFIDEFSAFVHRRKFHFSHEMLSRFVFSLRSKPFVILSGISGSGKTKIAQLFAEFMSANRGKRKESRRESQRTFEYQTAPYNFEYSRMIVPREIVALLSGLDLQEGEHISIHFGDKSETALLKQERPGVVRLGFRRNFLDWFKSIFKPGQTLYIRIDVEGENWEFRHQPFEEENPILEQACFLSVRPNWLDHRAMVGFYNPILESYQVTEFLKTLLRARKFKNDPFFVILDEMNLAKVEYYFSDLLSCMESRRLDDSGMIIQESFSLHNETEELSFVDEDGSIYHIPSKIKIPPNLYIVGTVNIDETTYMFSPKVLDRAQVIECNEIDFYQYRQTLKDNEVSLRLTYEQKRDWFTQKGTFHHKLYAKDYLEQKNQDSLNELFQSIEHLHTLMVREGYAFGYRVMDEMFTMILEGRISDEIFNDEDLYDIAVLQKVLPKLHGNRAQIEHVLTELFQFCLNVNIEEEDETHMDRYSEAISENYEDDEAFRYPLSARKVQAMYRQLQRTGYCSFIQ